MGNNLGQEALQSMQEGLEPVPFLQGQGWEGAQDWIHRAVPAANVPLAPVPVMLPPNSSLIDTLVTDAPTVMQANLDALLDPTLATWGVGLLGDLGPVGAGLGTVLALSVLAWRLFRRTTPHVQGLGKALVRGAKRTSASYQRNILKQDVPAVPAPVPPKGGPPLL